MSRATRGRGMRRIDHPENGPACAQLNLVTIEKLRGAGDALAVYERAVKAFEVDDRKLPFNLPDFCVPPRNNCRVRVDDNFAFRIAAQPRDFFAQFETFYLRRKRID